MARRKRRRRFAGYHSPTKVNRMALVRLGRRVIPVSVVVRRSMTGHFVAFACSKTRGKSIKARHCGSIAGGSSPTKAAGRALESLGATLLRVGR